MKYSILILWSEEDNGLFGNCYAMDGGYKGWNPYRERHLAIFVIKSRTINIYGSVGSWYDTNVYGEMGVIHSSQIKFDN